MCFSFIIIRCPTLIIHGTEDKTIPIEHSAALHAALDERFRVEPFWAMGKGHNDMNYNFDPFIDKVTEFLYDHVGGIRVETKDKKKRRCGAKRDQILDNNR